MTNMDNNNGKKFFGDTPFKGFKLLTQKRGKLDKENSSNNQFCSYEVPDNTNSRNNEVVLKVILSDYGFEQAGVNRGDQDALANFLNSIKEGHIVDKNFSEADHLKRKAEVEEKISGKINEIIQNQNNGFNIEQVLIPEKNSIIQEKEDEIKKIERDKIEGKLSSDYKKIRHIIYSVLLCLLGIYLVLFYASAINSAFFRNLIRELTENGSTDNLTMLLNSIFDAEALFKLKPSLIFIYLGSSLFFTIGLLAHVHFHRQKNMLAKIFVGIVSFGIPLIADFLIAHKIHLNIIQVRQLLGRYDNSAWYLSDNFWLVIMFGYLAYMAWALLFEENIREGEKRNTDKVANYLIKALKEEIRKLKEEIKHLRIQLNEYKSKIAQLQQEVESLKAQLSRILQDPNLLFRNLYDFYEGWLRYINAGNMRHKRKACEDVFQAFISQNFNDFKNN